MTQDCNSSTPEAEAGGLRIVFSQPGLYSEFLGQPELQHEKGRTFLPVNFVLPTLLVNLICSGILFIHLSHLRDLDAVLGRFGRSFI